MPNAANPVIEAQYRVLRGRESAQAQPDEYVYQQPPDPYNGGAQANYGGQDDFAAVMPSGGYGPTAATANPGGGFLDNITHPDVSLVAAGFVGGAAVFGYSQWGWLGAGIGAVVGAGVYSLGKEQGLWDQEQERPRRLRRADSDRNERGQALLKAG